MGRPYDRGTARLLMRLYPRSVRERYGSEIVDLFVLRLDEERHASGPGARALRWSRATADLVLSALLEHRGHRSAASTAPYSRTQSPPAREPRLLAETVGDLRVATRVLSRQPVFAAIAVLALAIGLGGNAVMFGVLDGLLLKPLPFEHADRLVRLDETWRNEGRSVAYLNFLDWREASRTFDRMAAAQGWTFAVVSPGSAAEVIPGALISGDLLAVLGGEPILGRRFEQGDFSTLSPRVAWIGESLWRRRFAAAPDVVGGPITLDGVAFIIAGAAGELSAPHGQPADLGPGRARARRTGPREPRQPPRLSRRRTSRAGGDTERCDRGHDADHERPGRALPGLQRRPWSPPATVARGLRRQCATDLHRVGDRRRPGSVDRLRQRRQPAAQQGDGPTCEMAIRASLGADRRRLVRQLLAESALLAGLGAALGLLLAVWGMRGARVILTDSLRLFGVERVVLDHRVVLITLAAASLTALLFGLAQRSRRPGTAPITGLEREGAWAEARSRGRTGPSYLPLGRVGGRSADRGAPESNRAVGVRSVSATGNC